MFFCGQNTWLAVRVGNWLRRSQRTSWNGHPQKLSLEDLDGDIPIFSLFLSSSLADLAGWKEFPFPRKCYVHNSGGIFQLQKTVFTRLSSAKIWAFSGWSWKKIELTPMFFGWSNWVEKPSTLVEIGLIVWPARSSHSMFVFIGFGRPWSKWCTLILSLSGCVAFLSCIACTTSIVGFLQESGFLSGPGQRLWWRVCHRCQEIVTWWEEKWKVIKTNEGLCVDYRDLTRLPHTVDDDM